MLRSGGEVSGGLDSRALLTLRDARLVHSGISFTNGPRLLSRVIWEESSFQIASSVPVATVPAV